MVAGVTGCGEGQGGDGKGGSGARGGGGGGTGHRVEVPVPPVVLTDAGARLEYVAARYWEGVDLRDTTWIADTAALEQAFADWTGLLMQLPGERAAELTGQLIRDAGVCPRMMTRLAEVAEFYFYHPNSPFRNEDWYIPVLEALVEAPGLAEEWKVRPRYQLEMARKNRPGMVANDFAYRTADGRTRRLHETGGKLTLLFFYNPDCRDCARVEGVIGRSAVLGPLVKEGRLTVLAVYPDADLAAWREHLPRMPRGWTVGYDEGRRITREGLYALPAIPTLYLLDEEKRVVLKDAPVERIEQWLHENIEKSWVS